MKKGVLLRPLKKTDQKALAKYANNKNLQRYMRDAMPYPYTQKQAEEFINNTLASSPITTFAIVHQNKFVGVGGLNLQTDIYRKSCEVGYWIGEPFWGRGFATQALKLLTHFAFTKLQMARVYTGVFEPNLASIKVLQKCGYKQEGIFVNALCKDGKLYNEIRFARTV